MSNKTSLSEYLRQRIRDCGASQQDIANETGIDPGQISRFQRGERGVNIETVERLLDFFDLEVQPRQNKAKGK